MMMLTAHASTPPPRVPVVELQNAGLTYPGTPPVTALRTCSLVVHAGDYVAIVGPSGAGKSSLLNLLGMLDRPTEGRYLLEGVDTSTLTETERTAFRGRRIGFVFQSFHLIEQRSATENVMLGLLYQRVPVVERRERARAALAAVGLDRRRDAFPSTMSGGERQRVAIARALVGTPALLLCDEPTGNLDSRTTETVLELLDELHQQGITIMVITHAESVAARGTRAFHISDGTLTEPRRTP